VPRRLLITARWLFIALTLAWATLWVASIWLWMRWEPAQGYALMVSRGAIGLGTPVKPPGARMGNTITAAKSGEPMRWRTFRTSTWFHNTTWRPIWMPTAACGLCAAATFAGALRRRPAWACAACGYDLRGLAATANCPECGAVRTAAADT
jgi:hypothetical protein